MKAVQINATFNISKFIDAYKFAIICHPELRELDIEITPKYINFPAALGRSILIQESSIYEIRDFIFGEKPQQIKQIHPEYYSHKLTLTTANFTELMFMASCSESFIRIMNKGNFNIIESIKTRYNRRQPVEFILVQ